MDTLKLIINHFYITFTAYNIHNAVITKLYYEAILLKISMLGMQSNDRRSNPTEKIHCKNSGQIDNM